MKKVLAIALSLALAFPAASLLAQQAPAKVQPVQVAYQGEVGGFMGMGMATTMALIAALIITVAVSNDDQTTIPATSAAAPASGTL